jgi:radical SAM protein with 4Fe4S-binding SPASM domain
MRTAAPKWVCLQLLQACNLRCSMCYEWGTIGVHQHAVRPATLALDVIERLVRELAPHRPHYDLFGGEPLYHPNIGEVVRLIKERGSTLEMVTNGTRLAVHAAMLADAQVERLWISLDGPPVVNDRQRGEGSFADAIDGQAALVAARGDRPFPRVGFTFTVTALNHAYLEETFLHSIDRRSVDMLSIEYQSYLRPDQLRAYQELLRDRFATREVGFARAFLHPPADFAAIDADAVARQIETIRSVYQAEGKPVLTKPRVTTADNTRAHFSGRFDAMADYHPRCFFPWLYAEVAASGDVTPCHTFYDLTFGNVNQQSLLEIWHSDRFEDARAYWREHLLPVCHACCLYHTDLVPMARRTVS